MILKYSFTIIISFLLLIYPQNIFADQFEKIIDLKGKWKFSIGDDMQWASPEYDDSGWEEIYVPSSWEDQGFHGYDGYAWYRIWIPLLPEDLQNNLVIDLGYIDDVDAVYVNGKAVGKTGSFPPNFITAYNAHRQYAIPSDFFKENKNLIAVRVYDAQLSGGIISGNIGLFVDTDVIPVDQNLQGYWKFSTGDFLNIDQKLDVSAWDEIFVPGYWENQGYKGYDGFAGYVKKFIPHSSLIDSKLVLVLGKIDDLDQVYINGQLIAGTGDMNKNIGVRGFEWQQFRGYYLPDDILEFGKENTIAVRVYDGGGGGGIYDGRPGLITQKNYIHYWRTRKFTR